MRRILIIGLLLVGACATAPSAPSSSAASNETEVTCRLIGSVYNPSTPAVRDSVMDETKAHGPTRVIWINPPSTTVIKTEEGYFYRCNAIL